MLLLLNLQKQLYSIPLLHRDDQADNFREDYHAVVASVDCFEDSGA